MSRQDVSWKVEGLTRGRELKDAYILILREREGERIFPVLIDEEGFNMIMQAMRNKDYTCSHLMVKLASRVGMTPIGIRLMQPANGKTQALIDFELVNEIVSITTPIAEAVVTALETRSSLWVQRTTFERQTRMNKNGGSQNMALPITAMSDKLISDALQAAVKEDNFELATILRDELNKRKDKESEIGAEE